MHLLGNLKVHRSFAPLGAGRGPACRCAIRRHPQSLTGCYGTDHQWILPVVHRERKSVVAVVAAGICSRRAREDSQSQPLTCAAGRTDVEACNVLGRNLDAGFDLSDAR